MGVYYAYDAEDSESLEHHGIIGMKWGVRRFQNPDGTLTPEGRERYYGSKETKKFARLIDNADIHAGQMSLKFNAAVRLMNTPQLKNVAARVHDKHRLLVSKEKELEKIEDNFYKSSDYDKYVTKLAKSAYAKNKDDWWKGSSFDEILWLYKNEDLDQGDSFNLWVKESKSPAAKQYSKLDKERWDLYKEIKEDTSKAVDDFLGEHKGDVVVHQNGMTSSRNDNARYYVNKILNTWDTFEDDFPAGSVSIEDLMRLAI